MEKIKMNDVIHEIISINQKGALLQIEFSEETDLSCEDLTEIEVLTSGGVVCASLSGYTTIYKCDGNTIILSNDGSVYIEPEPVIEPEPHVPTEEEIARQSAIMEIADLKRELEDTDYMIIKCSEYQLAGLDAPYDIMELHTSRQALRDRINVLEINQM